MCDCEFYMYIKLSSFRKIFDCHQNKGILTYHVLLHGIKNLWFSDEIYFIYFLRFFICEDIEFFFLILKHY